MRWLPAVLVIGILATGLCSAAFAEPLTIDFQGQIDGSDRIEVYPDQASWTHNLWKWPTDVYLNGVAWDPSAAPNLSMPNLIPADISRYSARIDLRDGRDLAIAEVRDDRLLIHLCDALGGSGFYDFQVVLTEKPDPTPSPFAELRIQGNIDGSDRLILTNSLATWENRRWHAPDEISLNGAVWDLQSQLTLPNSGDTQFLPDGIDLTTARMTKHAGRDTATLEIFDDRTELVFVDSPNGTDLYDVTVSFGSAVPEPSSMALVGIGFCSLVAYTWRKRRTLQSE